MRVSRRVAICAGLAALAGGCSWFEDDAPEPAAEGPEGPVREPVDAVERLEIGRTGQGIALAAYGVAPGIGYAAPRLVARREGRPGRDGMLDFDFFVTPPDPRRNLPRGGAGARRVRADLLLDLDRVQGVRGIRVHAIEGGMQLFF